MVQTDIAFAWLTVCPYGSESVFAVDNERRHTGDKVFVCINEGERKKAHLIIVCSFVVKTNIVLIKFGGFAVLVNPFSVLGFCVSFSAVGHFFKVRFKRSELQCGYILHNIILYNERIFCIARFGHIEKWSGSPAFGRAACG